MPSEMTAPRIAIPVPHSSDREYAERALPQYEEAVRMAGGEPVRIALDLTPAEIKTQLQGCDGVLLPGSGADVDPKKYASARHEKTAAADGPRETVDELILHDAYSAGKPILGICYGLQTLNVFRRGTLVQDIESPVQHDAGRKVPHAHDAVLEPESKLAAILGGAKTIPVNSSHHQSADVIGENLRVVARSPVDGVIEALEGTLPGHFVVAVQWHPERSVKDDPTLAEPARRIFNALVAAARDKHRERIDHVV